MLYDLDMRRRLTADGFSAHVYVDMTADIFCRRRLVAHVEGEWGLFNWMEDNGIFEGE